MSRRHKLISKDVIRIFDSAVRPPKEKWHLCVCPIDRYFLRINTRALWPPHFKLLKVENPFLHHDSYVELRALFQFSRSELEDALHDANCLIGRLDNAVANRLAQAAQSAHTLNQDQAGLILENLGAWH